MKKVRTALFIVICFGLVLPLCFAQGVGSSNPATNSREAYDVGPFVPASRMQHDHARPERITQDDGDSENVELIGSLYNQNSHFSAGNVAIAGNYAYVAAGTSGLRVVDVSDPAILAEVGFCDTLGQARDVAVAGEYAYVAGVGGLSVVDISDPANPAEVGFRGTPVGAYGVVVTGGYAYVADGSAGLCVVDVSDPANPMVAGTFGTPGYAFDVAVAGDYAYVAEWDDGLRVVDVSDPTNPTEVGYCGTSHPRGVAVAGDYAYVAADWGLHIVDISDPANPTEVGFCDTPDDAYGTAVSGDYAYVAGGDGLNVVDASDPANPTVAGFCGTQGGASSVAVAAGYAYVAAYRGLLLVDISDPSNLLEVGYYDSPPVSVKNVAISGDYAFVAGGDGGLRKVDISNPATPRDNPATAWHHYESYWCSDMYSAVDVAIAGNYAYVVFGRTGVCDMGGFFIGGGLCVVDISDPVNTKEVGLNDTLGVAKGVAVAGNYAYIASLHSNNWEWPGPTLPAYGGLCIIDISDPTNLSEVVGLFDTPGYALDVAITGEYAYLATDSSGLRVVDISNPINPTEAGFYDTPGAAVGVTVAGEYAYVADGDAGLRVVDISDPANPTEVGFCDTPDTAKGVAIAWDYAYVAADSSGLRVIDISDPAHPTEVGYYDTPGCCTGVAVAGEYIYVADGDYFHILRSTGVIGVDQPDISAQPFEYSIRSVYPNPFNPSTTISISLPRSAELKMAVYNLLGRQIAELANRRYQAGYHRFVFDGSGLPSGVYFVRAAVPGEMNQVRKVVLMK